MKTSEILLTTRLPSWLRTGAELIYVSTDERSGRWFYKHENRKAQRFEIKIKVRKTLKIISVDSSEIRVKIERESTTWSKDEGRKPKKSEWLEIRTPDISLLDDCTGRFFFLDKTLEIDGIYKIKLDWVNYSENAALCQVIGCEVLDTPFGRAKCWILERKSPREIRSDADVDRRFLNYREIVWFDEISMLMLRRVINSELRFFHKSENSVVEEKNSFIHKLGNVNFPLEISSEKICSNCQARLPTNARFCGKCGAELA